MYVMLKMGMKKKRGIIRSRLDDEGVGALLGKKERSTEWQDLLRKYVVGGIVGNGLRSVGGSPQAGGGLGVSSK